MIRHRSRATGDAAGSLDTRIADMLRSGSPEPPRRSFLRGLLTLPLIGGGVTLIGAPTAVAEPCTDALLARYADWLGRESVMALAELEARPFDPKDVESIHYRGRWVRAANETNPLPVASASPLTAPASTRAALVLSAVGLDWRRR